MGTISPTMVLRRGSVVSSTYIATSVLWARGLNGMSGGRGAQNLTTLLKVETTLFGVEKVRLRSAVYALGERKVSFQRQSSTKV